MQYTLPLPNINILRATNMQLLNLYVALVCMLVWEQQSERESIVVLCSVCNIVVILKTSFL